MILSLHLEEKQLSWLTPYPQYMCSAKLNTFYKPALAAKNHTGIRKMLKLIAEIMLHKIFWFCQSLYLNSLSNNTF